MHEKNLARPACFWCFSPMFQLCIPNSVMFKCPFLYPSPPTSVQLPALLSSQAFWFTIHSNENYGLYTIIKNRIFTFVVFNFGPAKLLNNFLFNNAESWSSSSSVHFRIDEYSALCVSYSLASFSQIKMQHSLCSQRKYTLSYCQIPIFYR